MMSPLKGTPIVTVRAIACTGSGSARLVLDRLSEQVICEEYATLQEVEDALLNATLLSLPEILLLEVDHSNRCFALVARIRKNVMLSGLIVVMLSTVTDTRWVEEAKRLKIHDYYELPYPVEDICERLTFLIKFKLLKPTISELLNQEEDERVVRLPFWKRAFDVLFSGVLLLVLSPLLLLIALLIRLESRGPVIYSSRRVGTGYRIFYFYKFRSMRLDAEQELSALDSHNQYGADAAGTKSAFVKLKNDPRITRVGRLIRKTSLDELPQLFNILIGDMSTVGNRPLPLYEARLLTSNEWSWRFLAPSGLTGLWQISRRGRQDMSDRERKKLDNFYARKYSILFDLKILLKTLPAAFQKENV